MAATTTTTATINNATTTDDSTHSTHSNKRVKTIGSITFTQANPYVDAAIIVTTIQFILNYYK